MPVQPTIVSYAGDGSTKNFTFQFDYLNSDYVKVRVDGTDVPFTFTSTKAISVTTAPLPGETLVISRETDRDRLVDFTDGSVLIEDDLDLSALQVLHIVQEALDLSGATLALKADGSLGAAFRRISDVGDPVGVNDAVNKSWAETAMTSQLQQATAAKNAAEAAEADTLTLKTQATNARNAAQVAQAGAEAAQSAAETAQTGAQAAQSAADTAKLAAQAAQSNASSSASAAAGSASAAASSASAAAQSATDAAASASSIDTSSFLTNSGAQYLTGQMFLTRVNNDGHLTFIRENSGNEVARASMTLHNPSYTLQFHEGDGPAAGGSMLARFDRASDGTALPDTKSIVTREKGDARYDSKPAYDSGWVSAWDKGQTMHTHGLGSAPSRFAVFAKCHTAVNGFVVGDVLSLPSVWDGDGSRRGSIWVNSTHVGMTNYPRTAGRNGVLMSVAPTHWYIRFYIWT